jgi:hypothetical protein
MDQIIVADKEALLRCLSLDIGDRLGQNVINFDRSARQRLVLARMLSTSIGVPDSGSSVSGFFTPARLVFRFAMHSSLN